MAWLKNEDKKKESLLKEGKKLGLNLSKEMSLYELEHRVAEAKEKQKPQPQGQKSDSKGEY